MKATYGKKLMYFLSFLVVFALAFSACDNGTGAGKTTVHPNPGIPADDADTSYDVTGLQIIPQIPYVVKGKTLQFQSAVTGAYTGTGAAIPLIGKAVVYWSLDTLEGQVKSDNTWISSNGLLTIGKDELLTALVVTVTSVRDPSVSASATVIIYSQQAWLPVVGEVSIDPATATLQKGTEMDFASAITWANKLDNDTPAEDVIWSIDETGLDKYTTIGPTGHLIVSSTELKNTLTIRATSQVDPTKSGTATVTLTPPPPTFAKNVLSYSSSASAPGVSGPDDPDNGQYGYLVYSPGMGTYDGTYENGTSTVIGGDRGYGWLEITMEYSAPVDSNTTVLGITTNDNANDDIADGYGPGSLNQGMPTDWWFNGVNAWMVDGRAAQEQFGVNHGFCNKRALLAGTNGNWKTVKLEFSTGGDMYYWPWAKEPLFLLFYFNPNLLPGIDVKINYIALRKLGAGLGSPYIEVPNFLPTGDFETPLNLMAATDWTGWRGLEGGPVSIQSVKAPFVPDWYYNPSLYN